jgi:integrase
MLLSYRLGIQNRKVSSNPARSVTHRREDNNRVRFLSEEEEKKLRKVIEAKWASHPPELDLAINAGIRKGSQYELTWDMIDLEGRMLDIPRTKNEEAIHVPLNDAAKPPFRLCTRGALGKGVCFGRRKRKSRLRMGGTGSTTLLLKLGLRAFAGMTCDTRCESAENERPLEDIADLLGHKFDDDETVRASGAEQTAWGGVTAWSNSHHNSHKAKRLGANYRASRYAVKSLGA